MKKYIVIFFTTFSGLWTLLEPFDIYKKIFGSASDTNMYLGILGLSVFITLSVYLLTYFRRPIIHLDRKRLEQKLPDLINSSEKRVWIASIAGNTLVTMYNSNTIIENALGKGVDMRIVVNDSEKEFIRNREKVEDIGVEGRIKKRIQDTLSFWKKSKGNFSTKQLKQIEVRVHGRDLLPNSIYIIDDRIFLIPYLYKTLGENSIMLEVEKSSEREIFEKLENVFRQIWDDSDVVN